VSQPENAKIAALMKAEDVVFTVNATEDSAVGNCAHHISIVLPLPGLKYEILLFQVIPPPVMLVTGPPFVSMPRIPISLFPAVVSPGSAKLFVVPVFSTKASNAMVISNHPDGDKAHADWCVHSDHPHPIRIVDHCAH
jgi:hypothetical protein